MFFVVYLIGLISTAIVLKKLNGNYASFEDAVAYVFESNEVTQISKDRL